jgi:hypothetical protein
VEYTSALLNIDIRDGLNTTVRVESYRPVLKTYPVVRPLVRPFIRRLPKTKSARKRRMKKIVILWMVEVLVQAVLSCYAIVDPDATFPGEFPFYVRCSNPFDICGGALVWPDIVLSAAHCQGSFEFGVDVSYYNASTLSFNGTGSSRRVTRQRRHPDYNTNRNLIASDLLVLKLDAPVLHVTPIPLNANQAVPADFAPVTVCGTGRVEFNGPFSVVLQKAGLYAIPEQVCRDAYEGTPDLNVAIRDDILCAGLPVDLQSICGGDSGGPLVYYDDDDDEGHNSSSSSRKRQATPLLVGLVSFARPDCGVNAPNGFVHISHFYHWIQQQICDLSDDPPTNCPDIVSPPPTTNQSITNTSMMIVQIDIMYGSDPGQTTFSIRNAITYQIVYAGPEYNPTTPYQLYTTEFLLPPGEYWFELYDTGSNGLTGLVRTGYYEIRGWRAKKDSTQPTAVTLVERRNGGAFSDYDRAVFVVPTQFNNISIANPTPTNAP